MFAQLETSISSQKFPPRLFPPASFGCLFSVWEFLFFFARYALSFWRCDRYGVACFCCFQADFTDFNLCHVTWRSSVDLACFILRDCVSVARSFRITVSLQIFKKVMISWFLHICGQTFHSFWKSLEKKTSWACNRDWLLQRQTILQLR